MLRVGILRIIFRTFKTWRGLGSFNSRLLKSPEALSCHCGHCRQLLPPSRRTRRRSWPPPWRSWCCWRPRVWPGRWRSSRRKMSTSLLSSMTKGLGTIQSTVWRENWHPFYWVGSLFMVVLVSFRKVALQAQKFQSSFSESFKEAHLFLASILSYFLMIFLL